MFTINAPWGSCRIVNMACPALRVPLNTGSTALWADRMRIARLDRRYVAVDDRVVVLFGSAIGSILIHAFCK